MADHLGVSKTYRKVLNHCYWPGVHRDVMNFICVCHSCQMVGKPNQKQPVAPLKPIPVLSELFSRVIIDCVGPLPKSKRGNQYILTIMCASICFPEAISLRTIKAPNIARASIKFFYTGGCSPIGFMSSLFQEVMFQLGEVDSLPSSVTGSSGEIPLDFEKHVESLLLTGKQGMG